MILPGHCRGDLAPLIAKAGTAVELGPEDLRDLPRHLRPGARPGSRATAPSTSRSWPRSTTPPSSAATSSSALPRRYAGEGADRIDLGCDPGGPWSGVGEAVAALRDGGHRVSIDSFDPVEVAAAVAAGADLVLSVNATNRDRAGRLGRRGRGDPRPAGDARRARRDDRRRSIARAFRSASTRSSSRSASASRHRWAVTSRSAAAIPRRRC